MIKVNGISKSFGKTQVLKNLSLDISDGEFIVILGTSGSGKSTLLNLISGLEEVDSGQIFYGDRDICLLNEAELTRFRKKNTAFIFQQYYLLNHMTVAQNVKMGADLASNKDFLSSIEAVGLKDKIDHFPTELSGGEQQRVAIARAISKNPKVLFLDEPTGALDEETGRKVLDYLVKLQEANKTTMVMVTHNPNIAQMADRVIKMNSGQIVESYSNVEKKTAYNIAW